MYLDIHPNISIHKGEYYIIGTKESLKEATEFKDDSLYEGGTKYLGKSKITAKTFTLPAKKEKIVMKLSVLLKNYLTISMKLILKFFTVLII